MGRLSKLEVVLIGVCLTVIVVGRASGAVFSFSNNSGISIPLVGAATPYPSTIAVSGVTGTVTHVTVSLNNLSHTFPSDIEVMLVSPIGRAVVLMADRIGDADVSGINLVFDDCAPRLLPRVSISPLVSGRFRPTDDGTSHSFSAPAPTQFVTPLSMYSGLDPLATNGNWSLYVQDDASPDLGFIGSWSIKIFTDAAGLPSGLFPVPCGKPDFDGDGRADTVVYQQATGNWYVVGSAVGFFAPALGFGGPGYTAVAGDYDGDGLTDPAVYHTSTGNWFAVGSTTGFANLVLGFGGSGYTPMPGDYDGDGETDPAVYHTSSGNWYVVGSTDGFFSPALGFGGSGFTPVPAAQ